MQECISQLEILSKNCLNNQLNEVLIFISKQLFAIEKLFPHKMFISSGLIVDSYTCSICNENIDTDKCIHIVDRLYCGEYAIAIANNARFDHVAWVERPAYRTCTIQYADDDKFFDDIRKLSKLILDKRNQVLHIYDYDLRKDYIKLGRNEICYCGSNNKFKKCCLNKGYIEYDHIKLFTNKSLLNKIKSDKL